MYVIAKMISVETVPGIGGGIKDSGEEDEFKYNIFDTL
jgi:hypothetical protein